MVNLNRDVLYLISKKLKNDSISLYSCLLINKIWCEVAIPILWKIPGKIPLTKTAESILFNVILSHLSEDSRDILKKQGIDDLFIEAYQPPLFNYVNFWRHLDLKLLDDMINLSNIKESNKNIIMDKLLKLFINKNTKFISLFIPYGFKYQTHSISWAEQCFSSLKFLHCDNKNKNIVEELATIARSIKKLIYNIRCCDDDNDIFRSLRLIEDQNNLKEIQIEYLNYALCEIIERSLIKKADTVQHLQVNWSPGEEFLSRFVNLRSLKMDIRSSPLYESNLNWCHLEKDSLPGLKVLKANIYTHPYLDIIIKNSNENLVVISLCDDGICGISYGDYHRRLIRAIYQNCPNLRYLYMPIKEQNIPEFEKLLINCQNLNGLVFMNELYFDYKSLYEVLNRSSPISLYKFKFYFNRKFGPKFKSLKSFFDNWNDRHPMLLHINFVNFSFEYNQEEEKLKELVNQYEVKGIVQKCEFDWFYDCEEFEWIRKKSDFY
jgi:hypothetical protein